MAQCRFARTSLTRGGLFFCDDAREFCAVNGKPLVGPFADDLLFVPGDNRPFGLRATHFEQFDGQF